MGIIRIDFSRMTGSSKDIKPRLQFLSDRGIEFYEIDTKDVYVWTGIEWEFCYRVGEGGGTEPTGLEALDEGQGIGWRLIGRDPAFYQPAGEGSVDFGLNYNLEDFPDAGTTGGYAFNAARNSTVTNWSGIVFGYGNVNHGSYSAILTGYYNEIGDTLCNLVNGSYNIIDEDSDYSNFQFVSGYSNNTRGQNSITAGAHNTNRGHSSGINSSAVFGKHNYSLGTWGISAGVGLYNDTVGCATFGQANLEYVGNNGFPNQANQPQFIVGNGTVTNGGEASVRSDAFKILHNGLVTAPSLSNSLIGTQVNESTVLITKHFLTTYFVEEAPEDSKQYARIDGGWAEVISGGGGITEAPTDGNQYARINSAWQVVDKGTEPTGLEKIAGATDEFGWRLIGKDPADYGVIGSNAVDFSSPYTAGTGNFGALATNSAVFGANNLITSNGYAGFLGGYANTIGATESSQGSAAFGTGNTIDAVHSFISGKDNALSGHSGGVGYSLISGRNNILEGSYSTLLGVSLWSDSVGTTIVGRANTQYDADTGLNSPTAPVFIVGNGTLLVGDNYADVRNDALVVLLNGTVTAPSLTTALIDAEATGKILTTKEWVTSNTITDDTIFIKNNTDTFASTPKVTHTITLTQAEYDGITPDENTQYLIIG